MVTLQQIVKIQRKIFFIKKYYLKGSCVLCSKCFLRKCEKIMTVIEHIRPQWFSFFFSHLKVKEDDHINKRTKMTTRRKQLNFFHLQIKLSFKKMLLLFKLKSKELICSWKNRWARFIGETAGYNKPLYQEKKKNLTSCVNKAFFLNVSIYLKFYFLSDDIM